MVIVFWLVLLGAIWALAYHRTPLAASTLLLFTLLAAWTAWTEVSRPAVALAWLAFCVLALINIPALRRHWLSDPALRLFRRVMPHMSRTEREALEAGTVGWEGELFGGCPRLDRLFDLPAPRLSPEEQAFLEGPVERLCAMIDDWEVTERLHDLPPEVWQYIKDNGFFGMIIPRDYGGLGFSALAHSAVVMKLATRSISTAVTVMVPNSLGPAELLLRYGTAAQKDHYLPRLARGLEVPCFALTGPEAGSDASGVPDRGEVCRGWFEGRETLGIRLNWEKRYITLGPVATLLGLAFRLYDPEHLLGGHEDRGITLALIPTSTPGIDIGNRHAPLSIVFQNGPNRGRDVFIPLDWVIGGRDGVGEGWRMLMECLAAGRAISLPALSTGAGKLISRYTGAYARIRRQFRQPIGWFEGVEEALARIAGHTYVMDAARTMTVQAIDRGEQPAVASAIVKYHLTERMRRVVDDAMDVQGGSGICLGPRNPIGRVYQAVPISITVEGANILTRSLIIFGQGAIRCHPFLLREIYASQEADADRASRDFDHALWGHAGLVLSNAARGLWLGLTGARLAKARGGPATRRYYQKLVRMSAAFALAADAALLSLGGELKRKERLSARLGDALSHLYLLSAVLRRFETEGEPDDDLPLLRWGCEQALYEVQQALRGVLRSLPGRGLARILRFLIFPLGARQRPPSDSLGHRVAGLLLAPSAVRDRLTAGAYLPIDPAEAVGRVDAALALAIAAEPIERRLREAAHDGQIHAGGEEVMLAEALERGIVDEAEAERYRSALAARRDVITVDEFPRDYWSRKP